MDKLRVLGVYPRFPKTFWGYKTAVEFVGKKSCMPPTGLLTVLAMLPEDRFDLQRVIDLNVEPLTDQHLINADLVFTSSMIVQRDSHDELIDRVHNHGKIVVAGGPWPTSYPEENSNADHIVSGEAEVTLHPFLEDLLDGRTKKMYTEKDVSGRGRVELTVGGKVKLNKTPIPKWDLINMRNYFSAAIQYSRGCPFDCEFCDITNLYGKESRTKSPEQMVREFQAIYDGGHRGPVFIVDDNFIGNRANVKQLLPAITQWQKERKYPFELFTEASMNLAWKNNTEILEGMVEAGFNQVFVGIESVNKKALAKMKKKQNLELDQRESVRIIQNAGIEVMGGFIIGLDGEGENASEELFDFIQETGIVVAMPGLLSALKGTRLYDRLKKEGRLRGESSGNNTHQLEFNFVPEQDEKRLLMEYSGLLKKLFDHKNLYDRGRVLQENLGNNRSRNRVNISGLKALEKSIRRQLFARGGLEYAKYLTETVIRNPSYFAVAISQAIKGYHFREINGDMSRAKGFATHTESLYEQFLTRVVSIRNKYEEDIQKRCKKISSVAHKVIKNAEREYKRIHHDFRDGVPGRDLKTLKDRVYNILDNC